MPPEINILSSVFRDNAHLIAALTFFAGLLIGNWQSIGRSRRKEFNDVSGPIRHTLLVQFSRIDRGMPGRQATVTRIELLRLGMYISRREKAGYDSATEDYLSKFEKLGEVQDLEDSKRAVEKLLSYAVLK